MGDENKNWRFLNGVSKQTIRLFLRTIPLLPAPELFDLLTELKRSRTDIDLKIIKAYESLQETSDLLKELEISLKERTEKVNFLRIEYERFSKLAEIEEDKAKVILDQLERTMGKGRYRERWISLIINLITGVIVFILGIFLSPFITKLFGQGK